MNLEERVVYWVNAGLTRYTDMYVIQEKIAALREDNAMSDMIIATQHYPEVNFGASREHNQFSEQLLREVEEKKGSNYTQQDVIEYLAEKGILFSETKRGGGATVVAPGQFIFYPVVEHQSLTGKERETTAYKRLIDKIIYNVIKDWDVPHLEIAQGLLNVENEVRERRDVWTKMNGQYYKIGSKGVQLGKRATQGGFVIYARQEGVDLFKYVNACGYRPEEVGVISIEQVTGKKPTEQQITARVKEEVKKIFRYDRLIEIPFDEIAERGEIRATA